MKFSNKIIIFVVMLCGMLPYSIAAQESTGNNRWYFGVGGGYRSNHLSFSNIDDDIFPTSKNTGSGLFSVFVQGEFGSEGRFGIRPQISFLNRGGKLTDIYKRNYHRTVDDIFYNLNAHYIDLRVPLMYNFGQASSIVRPYVFIAPVLGIATGGDIRLQSDYTDNSYGGYRVGISEANLAKTYFAGQIGAGVRFAIPLANEKHIYLGVELDYELGFTDTYSGKEKDGKATDVAQLFNRDYRIEGTRKFSGFEVQATLSIPFDIFKSRKPEPEPEPVIVVEEPEPEPELEPEPVVEEKPCYTLDEVIMLMAQGENVEGKTICAVDDINFDFSKSSIKPESFEYLNKLAETLIRTNKRIEVKGHTDNVGSDDFNMNLSRERAEAVVEYLVKKGVSRNKLTYSYYGKTKPLTSNDTEEGRAMNRRVEFTILNDL